MARRPGYIQRRIDAIKRRLSTIRNPLTKMEAYDLLDSAGKFYKSSHDIDDKEESAESYGIGEGIEYAVERFGPKATRHRLKSPAKVRNNPFRKCTKCNGSGKTSANTECYACIGKGKIFKSDRRRVSGLNDGKDTRPDICSNCGSRYCRCSQRMDEEPDFMRNPLTDDEFNEILDTSRSDEQWLSKHLQPYKSKRKRNNPTLIIARNPGGKKARRKSKAFRQNEGELFAGGAIISEKDVNDFESDAEYKKALAMYRKFHDTDPESIIEVEVADGTPKFLVAMGKAPEVTYDPMKGTKKYKKARHKKDAGPCGGVPFMHEWEDAPFLATNDDGKWLGYVGMGDKYKINFLGIHG